MTKEGSASRTREAAQDLTTATTGAADAVRDGVGGLTRQLPDVIETVQASARSTTASLRGQPDENLRLLVAASVGVAAGCYLAGAPRLLTLAALAPALLVATALMTRTSGRR